MAADLAVVTCLAPVNIALIKYWGKRNEELILPMAGSISVTLNIDQMHAKTTVAKSNGFSKDRFWLNDKEQSMDNPRMAACINEIKNRASQQNKIGNTDQDDKYHIHICSTNNFPTAAGLASSAAGYACLVSALAKLYGLEGDISDLARRGSGSACRSILGGFVEWVRGEEEDGSDSLAHQIAPASHWPELKILVLVANDQPKAIGSSEAMRRGVASSDFLHYWANQCVPKQIPLLKAAILKKDFPTLANMTMKASNQLHAVCLDGFPPVAYMNDGSHAIVRLVHAYNSVLGQTKLAYTFDAGPNACLLLEDPDVPTVLALLQHFFPSSSENASKFIRGRSPECQSTADLENLVEQIDVKKMPGALQYIICTQMGNEPVEVSDHLLNDAGYPAT